MIYRTVVILIAVSFANVFSQTEKLTKMEYYQKYIAKPGTSRNALKAASAQDRKSFGQRKCCPENAKHRYIWL